MQRNLMIKTGVIVFTILACIFGVIGFPTSLKQAEANAGQRIHLGLDLSGGTYLILQVQVQDAAKADRPDSIIRHGSLGIRHSFFRHAGEEQTRADHIS